MICPFCQHPSTRVVDSRVTGPKGGGIRRRRECPECERRFSTLERIEQRMPQVVKKDGRRETFDVGKVLQGLQVALRKRPVSSVWVQAAVQRIEQGVFAEADKGEISTHRVGEFVLAELRSVDRVAFLRFASVYQEFNSAEEFMELIQPLLTSDSEE
ncbi:MAG: transcriptional repressor NrdR [Cognaticolwellia sp.]